MVRSALDRRRAIGLLVASLAAPRAGKTQTRDRLILQTGWRAQAEHGGFYQALATGKYRDAGLDVEIRMGGPQLDPNPLLMAGRVDFIISGGGSGFAYVRENLPFLVIAAMFQKDPRVLLSHPGVGNDTLEQLWGKPILVAASGRNTYWPWLRARYGYRDEQLRPYTFSMAPFLADRMVSMQGLVTSEPPDLRKVGVDPVIHLLADHGWLDYQSTLNSSAQLVREKPDVVQRFVDASISGWRDYLHGDPTSGNLLIRRDNPDMLDERIASSRSLMMQAGLLESGDAATLGIGAMTDVRWRAFYNSMVVAGAQPAGLDIRKAYTTQFVNRGVGLI